MNQKEDEELGNLVKTTYFHGWKLGFSRSVDIK